MRGRGQRRGAWQEGGASAAERGRGLREGGVARRKGAWPWPPTWSRTHCTACPTSLPHRRSLKFLAASSTRPHSVNGAGGGSGLGVSAPDAEGVGLGVNMGGKEIPRGAPPRPIDCYGGLCRPQ